MDKAKGIALLKLMERQPVLADKLIEALEINRFLITISFLKKDKPEDAISPRHWWIENDYLFNPNSVPETLIHFLNDWKMKNQPTIPKPKENIKNG